MAYQNEKNTQAQGQGEQALPEEEFTPEQRTAGLPNSLIMSMPVPPPGLPNSVMREMLDEQIPGTKSGSVSAGMYSAADDTVRRERAGGRFSPSGEPHELVHSPFRQQAASERVKLSVSGDMVQREVDDPKPAEGFAKAAKTVLLIHRFKKRLLDRIHGKKKVPRSDQKSEDITPAPSTKSSLITAGTTDPDPTVTTSTGSPPVAVPKDDDPEGDDRGSSTFTRKPVRTASFKDLYVLVDDEWTDAKAAEAMIINSRKSARSSSGTTTTTVEEEPDPDIPPQPHDENGEVVRDTKSGLWVERNGQDLFVYIDKHWVAAMDTVPAASGSAADAKPHDTGSSTGGAGHGSGSGGGSVTVSGGSHDSGSSTSTGTEDDGVLRDDTAAGNALPNETRIFGTGWRWRMSRTALTDEQINGMVAYYKDYARRHRNRVFATSPKIVAGPIRHALQATSDAVPEAGTDQDSGSHADEPAAPVAAPGRQPDADGSGLISDLDAPVPAASDQVPGVLRGPDNYHRLGDGWKSSMEHTGNAAMAHNVGMGVNAFGRQGVLLNNYLYHVSSDAKEKLDVWDESKWKLPTSDHPTTDSDGHVVSQGDYDPYVNYVAPIAGAALGAYGTFTGAASMAHGIEETIRNSQNVAAGASRWDAAQSGLNTVAATSSTMSSIWGTVQSIGNIGGAATSTFGDAVNAVPGLSIVTGAANAISGTAQAIRGGKTKSELNAAGKELARVAALQQRGDSPAPAPAPGQLTDQQKLQAIMKQGHQSARYNMWSGGMKAVAGGLTIASGISSLAGAAPVAAGIQGVTAVLNLARFIFERAYKSHMRNSIVGEEFDIKWSVRERIYIMGG